MTRAARTTTFYYMYHIIRQEQMNNVNSFRTQKTPPPPRQKKNYKYYKYLLRDEAPVVRVGGGKVGDRALLDELLSSRLGRVGQGEVGEVGERVAADVKKTKSQRKTGYARTHMRTHMTCARFR